MEVCYIQVLGFVPQDPHGKYGQWNGFGEVKWDSQWKDRAA